MVVENLERNKKIVNDWIFQDKTLAELGREHNISRERIRQILEFYGVMARREHRAKQRMIRLYKYLVDYKLENDGNTPTQRQMVDEANLSTATRVRAALKHLEQEGYITIRTTNHGRKTIREVSITGGKWIPPESDLV